MEINFINKINRYKIMVILFMIISYFYGFVFWVRNDINESVFDMVKVFVYYSLVIYWDEIDVILLGIIFFFDLNKI